ncbi:flagellar biosynthesis protein FlhB [Labrys wisconsinensis]|uniref:Flagellar biosynthetic protein FlhB n=1 Tax=Labrys wisconsinensis TaxID=425677 RepID=A0ABU0JAW7_9HYPH|nr:flagellar biosynthesis protein FlhB [Labrys wisconsinensis]MDQ0471417.1 flagellar biosynthetic protein FlhB [Labrys wisconsinensis]
MAEDDAGERTLDPTQKKLDQAVERGDVAKSQELGTWFVLGAGTLAFFLFAKGAAFDLTLALKGYLANAGRISLDAAVLTAAARQLLIAALAAIGLPLLMLMIAAVAGNAVQHRLVWSYDPITPKLSKISPLAGFKRLFGMAAWVNFGKGLAKLAIVGAVLVFVLWPKRASVAGLLSADVATIAPFAFDLIVRLLASALAILTLVALADFVYQRHSWYQRQRMTVHELKEEFKQSEGNPEIKAKIKQMRRQRASKRMMANVPKASVVITNPTHYAVALRYEAGMGAPVCVAKGVDAVALRIRALAAEHGVAVVENPPLARALHATVDVDREIPGEHYRAVAEVISYVMKLKARRAWRPA